MQCLTPGCELAFGYLGKARLMIVTGFAEDDVGEFVTITAKDAASVALESRVATVATRSTSGNSTLKPTTKPTTNKSPAPLAGIIAGLGAALVIARLRR